MAKYRKKPVVIDAYKTDKEMDIETLEGVMHANKGDWIITGVNGEQYPCKPDIFAKTYESADKPDGWDIVEKISDIANSGERSIPIPNEYIISAKD